MIISIINDQNNKTRFRLHDRISIGNSVLSSFLDPDESIIDATCYEMQ